MQVIYKLLRRGGARIPQAELDTVRWMSASLESPQGVRERKNRVVLRHGMHPPGLFLAQLYQPTVVEVGEAHMVIRGIERVEIDGSEAAVLQEWMVRQRPEPGDLTRGPKPSEITGSDLGAAYTPLPGRLVPQGS